jgi:hypothetical protein
MAAHRHSRSAELAERTLSVRREALLIIADPTERDRIAGLALSLTDGAVAAERMLRFRSAGTIGDSHATDA